MDGDQTTFPMDVTDEDPSSRPWNFHPEGHLVVIIAEVEAGGDGACAGRIRAEGHQALHGQADPGEPGGVHRPTELAKTIDDLWAAGQQELADESTAGSLETVSGAGHEIQVDQPTAVIDALMRIFDDLATS